MSDSSVDKGTWSLFGSLGPLQMLSVVALIYSSAWAPGGASLDTLLYGLEVGSRLPDIPEQSLKYSGSFHESSGRSDETSMKVQSPRVFEH